jgi:hypothetical protein
MIDFLTTYPVQEVTKEDTITYVSLLLSLAAIDGIDEQESETIKKLIENNQWDSDVYHIALSKGNLGLDELNLTQDFINILGPYITRDLLAIAHVSHGISDQEENHIRSVSSKFGVSNEQFIKIKEAVVLQFEAISSWSQAISV